jgi:hypothetical protein
MDLPFVHEAIDAIPDAAIQAQTRRDSAELLDEWDKTAARGSKLRKWLACERNFPSDEIDLSPKTLQLGSFGDPAREPRVISEYGSRLGKGLARFRALESRLSH